MQCQSNRNFIKKIKVGKNAKIYPLNDYLLQKIGYKNINWQAFTKHTESYGIHTARMVAVFIRSNRTRIKAHTQKRIAFQILCALNRLVFFLLKQIYWRVFSLYFICIHIYNSQVSFFYNTKKNTLFPNLSS